MKSNILPCLVATLVGVLSVSATPPPSLVPNAEQQRMIDRSYGMFIHFGINTFSGKEWTDGTLDPKIYNPTKLDTDQWAKTAKDAGMTYVILTVKHIDGFCLWDSEHTEYDVASSPVKTDIIKSMAESCKKYGIELGIYYALWDRKWGDGVMRSQKSNLTEKQSRDYAEYMKSHLTEILSNYGDVCELWLDGGWVLPREQWHMDEIYAHVKKLQPKCPIGVNWNIGRFGDPDFHKVAPNKYLLGQRPRRLVSPRGDRRQRQDPLGFRSSNPNPAPPVAGAPDGEFRSHSRI